MRLGYVGRAKTTLNKVGRSPVPACFLTRVKACSADHEDRGLVIGLSPDPHRPAHLLLMASEDVELTLLNLEGLAADSMGQVLWRRFNRSSLQIQRDSSDRLVIPRDLREAAGLGLGELIWLGDRNKIRLFSPENWALYIEIEEADLDFSEGGSLATERGRTGGLI
ncbi:MAG: hypothetical protein CMH50_06145 [Myxococcales bacterium]|nr:hypothetical protein [Myxococcales bacterium]